MRKISLSKLCLFAFLLFIISCQNGSSSGSEYEHGNDKYIVGANLPLTGNAAYYGVQARDGLKFGFEHFSDFTEGKEIKVIYEDNNFNLREAVGITKRLIEVDKADVLISAFTPIVKATLGVAESTGTLMLATLTSADQIAKGKEWVFRDFTSEAFNMPMIAEYAYEVEGFRKGSYLVVNDDFGRDARRHFELSFTSIGGSLLRGEFFETTDLDLRNKIGKVLADKPEFILLVGRGSAMINACRQIREVDKDIRIYSAAGINNPKIWTGLGHDGDGVVYVRIDYDESTDEFKSLNSAFKQKFGYDMTWVNVYGYTIARYLAKGFSIAGKDKNKMKEYLQTLDFESIRGRLEMDERHNVVNPMKLYIRKEQESFPIDQY